MIERKYYGIAHLCELGKGKFISGVADFGMARSWLSYPTCWTENSNPGIYRWNLLVFFGLANKAQVANNGKYNFFAVKYKITKIWLCENILF